MIKTLRRHKAVFSILHGPVRLFCRLAFGYTFDRTPKIKGPYLLLANHTTNFDPLFVASGLRDHLYFVASEHIFRRGLLSRLLVWALAPIPRTKGSTDASAALQVLRTLRGGHNVGLFAEGNRSWSGKTGEIHPTTARLVLAARAPLVTYRLTGGYFTNPRWGGSLRRGRMHGCVVQVYPWDVLQTKSEAEITEIINRDLYVDAYADQRAQPVRYRGRRLAERLETAIYACPVCRETGLLHSAGDRLSCRCGLSARFTEFGLLEGAPFETLPEWDAWQTQFMAERIAGAGAAPIFSDDGQALYALEGGHTARKVSEGTMRLYRDRLTLGDFSLPLGALLQISLHGRETLVFSDGARNFEVRSPHSRCGRKYETAVNILKRKREKIHGLL